MSHTLQSRSNSVAAGAGATGIMLNRIGLVDHPPSELAYAQGGVERLTPFRHLGLRSAHYLQTPILLTCNAVRRAVSGSGDSQESPEISAEDFTQFEVSALVARYQKMPGGPEPAQSIHRPAIHRRKMKIVFHPLGYSRKLTPLGTRATSQCRRSSPAHDCSSSPPAHSGWPVARADFRRLSHVHSSL